MSNIMSVTHLQNAKPFDISLPPGAFPYGCNLWVSLVSCTFFILPGLVSNLYPAWVCFNGLMCILPDLVSPV